MRTGIVTKTIVYNILMVLMASSLFAKVHSIPSSTRLVQGKVTLANGELVKFAVLEGAMLTVMDTESGYYYGFTPSITDEADLAVNVTSFNIEKRGRDLHILRQAGSIETFSGLKAALPQDSNATIEITGIIESGLSQSEFEALRNSLAVPAKIGSETNLSDQRDGDECCVTCGSTTACACAVEMSCGSCCAGTCCSSGGGGPSIEHKPQ